MTAGPGVEALEQEPSKKRRLRRTWWFWVLVAVAVVVVLGVGAVVADWLVYRGEVHAGVTVDGIYLRGMTEEQAKAALSQYVDSTGGIVTLTSAGKTWTVTPTDVGRNTAIESAVKEALALSDKGNFLSDVVARFSLYRDGEDIPLTIAVDQSKIQALADNLAAELHITPVDASLSMENGAVKVIEGIDGQDVNTQSLVAQLQTLFKGLRKGTVDIPLIVTEPNVQVVDNEEARLQAELLKSAPVTLTDRGNEWTLSPEQIASWMDFKVDASGAKPKLVPFIVEGRMVNFLAEVAGKVHVDPVDAGLKSDDRVTVKVIPAVEGQTLNLSQTAAAISTTAAKSSGRTTPVVVDKVEPLFTTAEAEATTFKDQLSSFTTSYSSSANRATNVRITTQYATNVFLAPGQEYNFDKQIGPRTAARGYKLAPGITGPNTLEDVLGGGICQVSYHHVQRSLLRRAQRHRTPQPLHLHQPLSQGPGRHRQRRGQEPAFRQRHRPLHLD